MKKVLCFALIPGFCLISCKKSNSTTDGNNAVKVFSGITFNAYDYNAAQFFSTFDTSFKTPLPQTSMTADQIKNVDLMYIYDSDEYEPGFMDPITASQHHYWDNYYSPWLASSVQTNLYITTLTADDFNAAKSNPTLLTSYFKDTSKIRLASNPIFPLGTCIGGHMSSGNIDPRLGVDPHVAKNKIFGFKNVKSGKLGLIHISENQDADWPAPIYNHNTVVDIVKQR